MMLLPTIRAIFSRKTIFALLTAGVLFQMSGPALADYDPPGGDPPPGRTSTSGMSLR